MPEGLNPTRRYKWFRPRQSARGTITTTTATNHQVVSLFNDSNGAQYLIVREFAIVGAGNENWGVGYHDGPLGSVGGTVAPIVPDSATLPGKIYAFDSATTLTPDYIPAVMLTSSAGGYSWLHDFPFAVLPPGWALFIADPATGNSLIADFFWEAIFSDELDYAFEL